MLKQTHAYDGSDICMIDEHMLVSRAGNHLRFSSVTTNAQELYLRTNTHPITAMDCCWKTAQIVYSVHEKNPNIHLLQYPEKKARGVFANGAKLEYLLLRFSRCGTKLLSVNRNVEHQICIWDIATFRPVGYINSKVPNRHFPQQLAFKCLFGSFNPTNPRQFVVGGEPGLTFWRIYESGNEMQVLSIQAQLAETAAGSSSGESSEDELRKQYVSHCWDKHERVYTSNQAGEILLFDSRSGKLLKKILSVVDLIHTKLSADASAKVDDENDHYIATSLVLTTEYLLVGTSRGIIYWLCRKEYVALQATVLPFTTLSTASSAFTSGLALRLIVTPNHFKAIAGTNAGGLYCFRTDIDEDENENATGATPPPTSKIASIVPVIESSILGVYHQGPILTMTAFYPFGKDARESEAFLATAGVSGLIHLWFLSTSTLTFVIDLTELHAVAAQEAAKQSAPASSDRNRLKSPLLTNSPAAGEASGDTGTSFIATAEVNLCAITSLTSACNGLFLIVGTAKGMFYLVCLRRALSTFEARILSGIKLFSGPMDVVVVDEYHESQYPVALMTIGSSSSNQLYFIKLDPVSKTLVQVIGFAVYPSATSTTQTIHYDSNRNLIFTTTTQQLYTLSKVALASAVNAKHATQPIEFGIFPISLTPSARYPKFQYSQVCFVNKQALAISTQSKHVFELASGSNDSIEVTLLAENVHGFRICAIARAATYLAFADVEGYVSIWELEASGELAEKQRFAASSKPITQLEFVYRSDQLMLYVVGLEGDIGCWYLEGGGVELATAFSSSCAHIELPFEDLLRQAQIQSVDGKSWVENVREQQVTEKEAKFDAFKNKYRNSLKAIKLKIAALVLQNQQVEELEQLQREEFVVNLHLRDEIVRQNHERVTSVRQSIEKEIQDNRIICQRLQHEFFDQAEEKGVEIHGLLDKGLKVVNFPIRKLQPQELERLHQLECFCQLEKHHNMKENPPAGIHPVLAHAFPSNASWIVHSGLIHPKIGVEFGVFASLTPSNSTAALQTGSSDPLSGRMFESKNDRTLYYLELLYHPANLKTRRQRAAQIEFVHALSRALKEQYNQIFQQLQKEKDNQMDEIKARNTRISEIQTELQLPDEVEPPGWQENEIPDSVLKVHDHECTSRPYETKQMRLAREAAEKEQAEFEKQRQKDDVGGRALMDMMNGTLEMKQDTIAATDLVREEWMDTIPVEEMTIEQKRALEEYDEKLQQIQQAQDQRKKALEIELKKLKAETQELAKAIDEKLEALSKLHFFTQYSIQAQSLYILRLTQSIARKEHLEQQKLHHQAQHHVYQKQLTGLQQTLLHLSTRLEEMKEQLQKLHDEDKHQERAFTREIEDAYGGPLDQETARTLLDLFRLRKHQATAAAAVPLPLSSSTANLSSTENPRKQSYRPPQFDPSSAAAAATFGFFQGSSSVPTDEATGDPFFIDIQQQEHVEALFAPGTKPDLSIQRLDPENDRPDMFSLDDPVWIRLNELRDKKIEFEHGLQQHTRDLQVKKQVYDEMVHFEQQLVKVIAATTESLAALDEAIQFHASNTIVMIALKQGQDESLTAVTNANAMDSFSDGQLVFRRLVEDLNQQILHHGQEQVSILTKIKDFRKSINLMEWEHSYLAQQAKDLDDHYTDLQLLRVTKQLQDFFKGGDHSLKAKIHLQKTEEKFEFLKVNHEQNKSKYENLTSQLQTQLLVKERENEKFENQLQELQAHVQIRKDILLTRKSGKPGNSGASKANAKMKAIAVRRKLVDLAKNQTHEIEYLRKELDTLRRRTFPSFVQTTTSNTATANVHNYYPPDEAPTSPY